MGAVRWLTGTDARAALGEISERTFARLIAKGLPRKGDGRQARYPWPEIQRWLTDHARQEGRESVRPQDYEDAKARKMMAEAELAEYDLALRRQELMTAEEGQKTLGEAFDRVRAQLLAMPSRSAHDFVAIQTVAEATARLTRAVAEVMAELAQGADVPIEPEEDGADEDQPSTELGSAQARVV